MLKLNRKISESIIITTPTGELIKIHLFSSSRSQSTLGIEAPENYTILRDELVDRYKLDTTDECL